MKNSLSSRLIYRIMAVVMAMMAIITGVVYVTVREYMLDEAKQRYESVLLDYHEELRRHLADIYIAAQNNVHDIEHDIDHPERMTEHMVRILKKNPTIACCALLFEPGYYPDQGKLFVPCARRDAHDSVRVLRIDSTYRKYYLEEWYLTPMTKDSDVWIDPYFESPWFAGNEEPRLLTTYTIPIHNHEGRPVALLGADIALEWLRNEMMEDVEKVNKKFEYQLSHKSYSFVLDRNGRYIVHPDKNRMLKDSLGIASTLTGERGATKAVIDGVESWLYYRSVKNMEWIIVIAVPKEVILSNGRMLNVIILTVMAVGLMIIYLFCRHQIKEIADPFAAQHAAVERELNIAHNIQMSMLPSPLTSHRSPIKLYATLTPAKDVGGDLYDYIVRDNRLYFCIGDVSGKGVPAALLMAVVQTMFHNETQHATRASDIMMALNALVCAEQNTTGFFVTMFVGILDLTTGHLDYCNAGHEVPEVTSKNGTEKSEKLPAVPNLPVGVLHDWIFEGQEAQLCRGDMLFLYTDGLSEAENPDKQLFGRKRVEDLVQQYSNSTPQLLIDNMMQAVRQHADTAEQNDDITMLALRFETEDERLEVPAQMDEMDHITDFVIGAARQAGMSERETKRLRLAVEEVAANIVNYSGASSIAITTVSDDGQLVLTIQDDGRPFDPTTAETADLSIPADERPPGGIGLVLLRQMTNSQEYQRQGSHNILTIRKNIE